MALPVYIQILQQLRARIAKGDWSVGKRIPTDEELMEYFGVSRFTVRAAVNVLVSEGIIKRFRGRGSFVAALPQGVRSWLLTSLEDLVARAFQTPPIILSSATIRCPPKIGYTLNLGDRNTILKIRTIRKLGAEPYSYSIIYIPDELAKALPPKWRVYSQTESFVGLIARTNACSVSKAIQTAKAIAAPSEIARILNTKVKAPLLALERTFLARDGTALEHSQVFCRPDLYKQVIEFRSDNSPEIERVTVTQNRRRMPT